MGLFNLFKISYQPHDKLRNTIPDEIKKKIYQALTEAKKENYLTALTIYKKIIPEYPGLEFLRNNAGCCLAVLEHFDEAETEFIEAIRITKSNRDKGNFVPRSYPREPTRNLIKLYKTVLAKRKYDPDARSVPKKKISFCQLSANYVRMAVKSIRRKGLRAVVKKFPSYLYTKSIPVIRWHNKVFALRAEEFDAKNNIDTAGVIYQTDLRIKNENQTHAVYYQGSDALLFNNALSSLRINFNEFTFIDFGSGKGKALFLASAYPFKKIIGIEFSEDLDAVARENIRRFKKDNIEACCSDVVDYKIPEESILCYFYDPFNEPIMAEVLENIRNAYFLYKKSIIIVYYIARFYNLFDSQQWLERVNHIGPVIIWSSKGHCCDI